MKFYFAPAACSMAPHIVLNELGKKYELEKVDLGVKKTETGRDFTKVNGTDQHPARRSPHPAPQIREDLRKINLAAAECM